VETVLPLHFQVRLSQDAVIQDGTLHQDYEMLSESFSSLPWRCTLATPGATNIFPETTPLSVLAEMTIQWITTINEMT
jgi:hypothetical protein